MARLSALEQELLTDAEVYGTIFLIAALIYWWVRLASRQRQKKFARMIEYVSSYTRPQGQGSGSGSGGASAATGGGESAAEEECAVCLGALEDGDVCCVLPACRHEFHRECMRRWFVSGKSTCPLCRTEVQRPSVTEIV